MKILLKFCFKNQTQNFNSPHLAWQLQYLFLYHPAQFSHVRATTELLTCILPMVH